MKKIALFVLLILGLLFITSCRTIHTNKNGIPPGQAKKITGSKSAKPYAPGQNK
ncbi:MAG: quinol oxidase subunit 4 [Dysgonomonas sp.]|nr:quinol oxidase subunit 4 [Dysgonomonas sp.]